MKVWVNKELHELENAWEIVATRTLRIVNTTGKHGKLFEKVYLGYKKFGKDYYIFINKHRNKDMVVEKTCGIWIAKCDYTVEGREAFSGKSAKRNGKIAGRFGIYEVGTVIEEGGRKFILDETSGWLEVQ
jgi:hypothetical protein